MDERSPVHRRLLEQRWIAERDLRREPDLLDAYPHRYVYVAGSHPPVGLAPPGLRALSTLFEAVERLEGAGWEVASWTVERESSGAVLRRDLPSAAP